MFFFFKFYELKRDDRNKRGKNPTADKRRTAKVKNKRMGDGRREKKN